MMDFVLIWVDGSDPVWKKEYNHYKGVIDGDKREIRFRDWDNLRYWFRGIEKFAPWVHRIHFVTCGHYPEWLNLQNPKLHLVKHSDFISPDYLPTFNSHTIELNLHRIEGLSEQFVYFNDDLFLINKVPPSLFFKNGLPCDMAAFNMICQGPLATILMKEIDLINRHFSKRKMLVESPCKWFNLKCGKYLLRTLYLSAWPAYSGFVDLHLPNAYLKKTFDTVWQLEGKELDKTCRCKFRDDGQINQYIFRYWQLASNHFLPAALHSKFQYLELKQGVNAVKRTIEEQKKPILILNDEDVADFERFKEEIKKSFEIILPEKSSFEL